MKTRLSELRQAAVAELSAAQDAAALDALRVKYLGKKGELTAVLKQMGKLSAEERPVMGQLANEIRAELESILESKKQEVAAKALELKLQSETLDVTLPGKKQVLGRKHPMYNVLDQVKEIFIGMGFEIVDGPEIELADYNFTKLNIEEGHPLGSVVAAPELSHPAVCAVLPDQD